MKMTLFSFNFIMTLTAILEFLISYPDYFYFVSFVKKDSLKHKQTSRRHTGEKNGFKQNDTD